MNADTIQSRKTKSRSKSNLRGFKPFSLKQSKISLDDSDDGTLDYKPSVSDFDSPNEDENPKPRLVIDRFNILADSRVGSEIQNTSYSGDQNSKDEFTSAKMDQEVISQSSGMSSPVEYEANGSTPEKLAVPPESDNRPDVENSVKVVNRDVGQDGSLLESELPSRDKNHLAQEYQDVCFQLEIARKSVADLEKANDQLYEACESYHAQETSMENEILRLQGALNRKERDDRQVEDSSNAFHDSMLKAFEAEKQSAYNQIIQLNNDIAELHSAVERISSEKETAIKELDIFKLHVRQIQQESEQAQNNFQLEKKRLEQERDIAIQRSMHYKKQLTSQEADFELFSDKIKKLNEEVR